MVPSLDTGVGSEAANGVRQDVVPGAAATGEATPPKRRRAPRRPLRWLRRNFSLVFASLILSVVVGAGVLAPWISPHDPRVGNLEDRLTPPVWVDGETALATVVDRLDLTSSAPQINLRDAQEIDPTVQVGDVLEATISPGGTSEYPLGTDVQGRDILSRLIHGARVSLIVMVITVFIGGSIGTILGLIAGFFGGYIDEVVMRAVDIVLALPLILVALVFVVSLGSSFELIILILAVTLWVRYARQVRAEVLQLREMDYVASARISGASTMRILFRHLAPGVVNTVVVLATIQVGVVLLVESSLSFLGAGIPPPNPAWGSMISEGQANISSAWWISTVPGLAIVLTVVSTNLLGDWLRDKLDPQLRQLE